MEQLIDGLQGAREICSTAPIARRVVGEELLRARTADVPHRLRAAVREEVRSGYHQTGTCAMGLADADSSVVDPRCRVLGIDGLWVADASVMPEIPSANTNLPTIMLAERAAEWVGGHA